MRKTLAAGLAALTFGGAVAAAAIPATAEARGYHGGYGGGYGGGYYGGYHHHDNGGAAVVAGIAGLAIGAALASNHPYYGGYGYGGYGYGYAPGYYGGYGYGSRTCISRHWVWDPYIGRRVLITSHYAC
jgi:hypothetical protein